MPVLVDDNEILERDKSKLMNVTITGIYKERKLIYVATDDLGAKPAPDDLLNFDGTWYKVNDCTDEAGILCIEMEANRS
nr:MAG TPA: Gifsy-2 prophage ATP-binding sugar transporter-like barrel, 4 helix bundle.7A [Caudoviricetes sp.]